MRVNRKHGVESEREWDPRLMCFSKRLGVVWTCDERRPGNEYDERDVPTRGITSTEGHYLIFRALL